MTDAAASEAESIDSIAAAGVPDARQAAGFVHDLTQRGPIHTTDVDGCRIVWRRFGAGPHVLLVHGGHGSWLHWARNIDALAARHMVWVPDLPGFGASGDPADGEMSTLVATLAAGFAQLPVDGPVDLVGFSFGGLTASYLASALPNVRSVALLGPGGHGGVRRQTINLVDWRDRKSTRLNSSHTDISRMPSSA
mgnify:CR=1 FL=1